MQEQESTYSSMCLLASLERPSTQTTSKSSYSLKASKMVSKILPIVALAGAAIAACPLSVEIFDTTHHIAQVAVKNTGAEPVTVFKGNTVLSDHATKDLLVANTGTLTFSPEIVQSNLTECLNRWGAAPIRGGVRQL
jgi:hypothetical protein